MKNRNLRHCFFILFLFNISTPFAGEPHICFAWLSDTHVGTATGAADLRRAVQDINRLDGLDFVILSGDITEMGSNAELATAKVILDSLNRPYHIIPGNHDTKWSESGCTKFSELWGSDKYHFEFRGYRFIGLHQGPLLRMGDGHFAREDLRWLDSLLVSLPDPDQPLIFITHYPIDVSVDNWYEFLDRVKKYQTRAILFGHGHRNQTYDLEGVAGVMGRSTLHRDQIPGGFNIVAIHNDTLSFYERIIENIPAPDKDDATLKRITAKNLRLDTLIARLQPWHQITPAAQNLSRQATIFARPDFSVNHLYPEVAVKWTFDTRYTITAQPCFWREWIVIGNRAGMVYGLSLSDGKKQWTFQTKGSIFSSPAIFDGKVVFGATDNIIYCLNVEDGRLLWQFATQSPVVAAPQVAQGVVFIGGGDGKFRAIKLKSGQLQWEFSDVAGFVETRPLIYQDKVIFGAWDTYLYALNKNNGTLHWKWSNGKPGRLYSPAACLPVAADNKIFIVAPDRFMTAIDARTGKTVWRTNAHKVREAIGISEDGTRIYARCMEDTLLAFSAKSNVPQLIRATACGYGYDIAPSMPIEKDGVIYFSTKNGYLFAVAARTGKVKFRYRAGVALVNTVTPIDAHRILVTDMDGRVMLIECQK